MTKIRSSSSRRIDDRRGRRGSTGGVGGGLPIPGGLKAGGGGLGAILIVVAFFVLPRLFGGGGDGAPAGGAAVGADARDGTCTSEIEQIVCGATDDVSEFWIEELPESYDMAYRESGTVFFSGATSTGCGQATSQTGPFYCPADELVYFDLDFLQRLQREFGATGDLAAQYIVAHEYGHHVQHLLGFDQLVRDAEQTDPQRANDYSIALELQADCLAGVWAADVNERGLLDGESEVAEAIDAAAAVGDDTIQERTQGRVEPETWTHGSSAQRVEWFRRGFETSEPARCDTFDVLL